jgi:predicted DNA-binding transcriptional regulator AlpA
LSKLAGGLLIDLTFPATRQLNRIIHLNTILDRTGLSQPSIYRKIAAGTFLPQIRIGRLRRGLALRRAPWPC